MISTHVKYPFLIKDRVHFALLGLQMNYTLRYEMKQVYAGTI